MTRDKKRALLALVVVSTALAFAVLAFWARAQANKPDKVFTVEKPRPTATASPQSGAGLENGLVPQGNPSAAPTKKAPTKRSYPGIYVNKGPADPKPLPSLQNVPVQTVDPNTAFDFRRQLEELGLYLVAGLKKSDPAITSSLTKIPSQLSTIEKSAPKVSGTVKIRSLASKTGQIEICLKGSSQNAGTWYYLVPEAKFALYDAARCP